MWNIKTLVMLALLSFFIVPSSLAEGLQLDGKSKLLPSLNLNGLSGVPMGNDSTLKYQSCTKCMPGIDLPPPAPPPPPPKKSKDILNKRQSTKEQALSSKTNKEF